MELTYCSTYWDILRCSLYSLSQRRELLLLLALSVVSSAFSSGRHYSRLGWAAFPIAAVVWVVIIAAIFGITLNLLVFFRLLTPKAKRVCTTTLTPEGITDVTLRKTKSLPWSAISEIRFHQGDIFLFRKGKDSMFVPRSAFTGLPEAQKFYQQNVRLWNAAKQGQAVSVPQDNTVWPPAPRH